jgi:hypothetical protein
MCEVDMSNIRTVRDREPVRINLYRIGAVVAQVLSFLTTYAFIVAVLKGATGLTAFLVSVGVELLLSLAKSAMFKARARDGAVGWAAIGFDSLLNAGGLWPIAKNIGGTPTATMIAEWLGFSTDVSNTSAVVIALALGFLLSILPWYLWRAGDDDE